MHHDHLGLVILDQYRLAPCSTRGLDLSLNLSTVAIKDLDAVSRQHTDDNRSLNSKNFRNIQSQFQHASGQERHNPMQLWSSC
eukprot:4567667-Amphidinium_carterae.1